MPDTGISPNTSLALQLLREMLDLGVPCQPDVVSYSTVVNGFCDEGLVERAQNLFEEMTAMGVKPNVIIYNALIKGYCKVGDTDKVVELLKEMFWGDDSCKPDEVAYSMVMGSLVVVESILTICPLPKWNYLLSRCGCLLGTAACLSRLVCLLSLT